MEEHMSRRGNGSAPSARDLLAQGQRIREDVTALAGAVRQVTHGWEAVLRDRLEHRPYTTLAAAAGIGYVLGGGLPTSLLRVLLGVGGRIAFERALTRIADPQSFDS
jgi:hypothetical protein